MNSHLLFQILRWILIALVRQGTSIALVRQETSIALDHLDISGVALAPTHLENGIAVLTHAPPGITALVRQGNNDITPLTMTKQPLFHLALIVTAGIRQTLTIDTVTHRYQLAIGLDLYLIELLCRLQVLLWLNVTIKMNLLTH